jgi:uncharacterized protein (UPF0210 family)
MTTSNISIRAITYSIDINKTLDQLYKNKVKRDIEILRSTFESKGIFVRTIRFNILPIKQNERIDKFLFLKQINVLSELCEALQIRWFNIAFDLIYLPKKDIQVITSIGYDIIKRLSNSFINFIVADSEQINTYAAKQCAQLILNISRLSENGYDNFRVGVSLNPKENTPFFPFSYGLQDGSFSIAVETAQPIIKALNNNGNLDLDEKREVINYAISEIAVRIDSIAKEVSHKYEIFYGGQDLSLAPFPDENISVIEILHKLGLDDIGSNGTLFLTAYLTGIIKGVIKQKDIKAAGFNGVMYSLLEDHLMCASNDRKNLSIDQIISYSALCGCGLDMVPIPGNILIEELASIILDVAAIAVKLQKPLGVRVLPIPNKEENEFTSFDMDFLTNTRILKLKNVSLNSELFQFDDFTI